MKYALFVAGVAAALAIPTAASASTHSTAGASSSASPAVTANCEPHPGACGYPDSHTTGISPTIQLQQVPVQVSSGPGWHFDSRGFVVVDGAGATLTNLLIPYPVAISAPNVTLDNDLIANGVVTSGAHKGDRVVPNGVVSSTIIAITLRHASGVTVQHCTISGLSANGAPLAAGIKDIYGDSAGLTAEDNDISDTSVAVDVEQGLVQHNYVHSEAPGSTKIAGIESDGRSTNQLTIENNTVLVGMNKEYAIGLFTTNGPQENRTVDGNLLAGGNYTIYGGQQVGGPASSNIMFTNNRVSRAFFANGGLYGPATAFNSAGVGNTWTGNFWDDTLAPIPAP